MNASLGPPPSEGIFFSLVLAVVDRCLSGWVAVIWVVGWAYGCARDQDSGLGDQPTFLPNSRASIAFPLFLVHNMLVSLPYLLVSIIVDI